MTAVTTRPGSDGLFVGIFHEDGRWWEVTLDGAALPPRHDLRNHSPDGFSWGYGGSGPSQLALAMLVTITTKAEALREYQNFKWACLARIPSSTSWKLPVGRIAAWLEERRATPEARPQLAWDEA